MAPHLLNMDDVRYLPGVAMRKFDVKCLTPVMTLTSAAIRRIRKREELSRMQGAVAAIAQGDQVLFAVRPRLTAPSDVVDLELIALGAALPFAATGISAPRTRAETHLI